MRKGRKISEDEIPPPVALGKKPMAPQEAAGRSPEEDSPAPPTLEPGSWRHILPCSQGQGPWLASLSCYYPLSGVAPALRGSQDNRECWEPKVCSFFDPHAVSVGFLFLHRQPLPA